MSWVLNNKDLELVDAFSVAKGIWGRTFVESKRTYSQVSCLLLPDYVVKSNWFFKIRISEIYLTLLSHISSHEFEVAQQISTVPSNIQLVKLKIFYVLSGTGIAPKSKFSIKGILNTSRITLRVWVEDSQILLSFQESGLRSELWVVNIIILAVVIHTLCNLQICINYASNVLPLLDIVRII